MEQPDENPSMRASQSRLPSRIPSPGKGLSEISDSQTNSRSIPASKMPPPTSLKHKLTSSLPEPDPKRKTLVEKAGEFRSIANPPTASRPAVKATSLVGASKIGVASSRTTRTNSFSSSVSSRPPLASSRNTSNSSFSASIGHGGRPQSFHGNRQQTAGQYSNHTGNASATQRSRPATAMGVRSPQEDSAGMKSSTSPKSVLHHPTLRHSQSMNIIRPKASSNFRNSSISTAMSKLRLDDPFDQQGHQVMSMGMGPPPVMARVTSYQYSLSTSKRETRESYGTTSVTSLQSADMSSANSGKVSRPPAPSAVEPKDIIHHTPTKPSRRSPSKSIPLRSPFLSKGSNLMNFTEWDVRERLERMEGMYSNLKDDLESSVSDRHNFEHEHALLKAKVSELESLRSQLSTSNLSLQTDLNDARQKSEMLQQRLLAANASLDDNIRAHRLAIDDVEREQRREIDRLRRDNSDEIDRLSRSHRDEIREVERKAAIEIEDRLRDTERRQESKLDEEKSRRLREIQDFEMRIASESQSLDLIIQQRDREIQNMRGELEDLHGELDREQTLKATAQTSLAEVKDRFHKSGEETASTIQTLEGTVASLRARILFLESGSKAQSDSFAEMEARLQNAVKSAELSKKKLIKEETLRRILFNQVQELKGNIRVMCRIRPAPGNAQNDIAKITYPDIDKEAKEVELLGKEEKSSLGTVTRKTHAFSFDRVFGPESQNQEVFEEIFQLVQSALDGYNVCIFCYGQTGSGKTHTMSSADGMIPRATHQIYQTATELQDKGWTYTMEGSFVEVYNEDIHDLLSESKDFDKKKHEIRHDDKKKQTTITGLQTVALDSPKAVECILKRADTNRSVAATKSNERSSRSHSVFILKLVGRNSATGETSEGTLNLVDLAGSERLKQSGAEGDRMKETQNINKSLSCLGDVIGALGQGKEGAHIPYRNSKLTYLLQYSLGGNSKTLMFVMASPMEAHLTETITSLKFATKVHNTHIGTAKKSTKVRERND